MQVIEAFTRIGKLTGVEEVMLPPVPCKQHYGYRNKMTFAVDSNEAMLENKEARKELEDPRTVGKSL